MINQKTKKAVLQKILTSQEFSGSKNNRALLSYLIECSIKGETPKETAIAIDVLGRDKDFNSNEDPIVRVYLHNLRKKLEAYYTNEGKNDKIRVEIPKGHYAVNFVTLNSNHKIKNSRHLSTVAFLTVIFVLALAVLYLYLDNRKMTRKADYYRIVDKDNPIWSEYLQSNLPILLVLGDHFFFREYNKELKKWRYIRDYAINTENEFTRFKSLNPNISAELSRISYFPVNSIWCLPDMLVLLNPVRKKVYLRRSSELTVGDLSVYNIIFVGSIKTLGLLDKYVKNSEIRYQLYPQKLLCRNEKADSMRSFLAREDIGGNYTDVAAVIKCQGPNDNEILIITSFFSIGVTEAVKYLTRASLLEMIETQFMQQYQHIPHHFQLVFKVRGIDNTGFFANLVEMKEIKNFNPWQ